MQICGYLYTWGHFYIFTCIPFLQKEKHVKNFSFLSENYVHQSQSTYLRRIIIICPKSRKESTALCKHPKTTPKNKWKKTTAPHDSRGGAKFSKKKPKSVRNRSQPSVYYLNTLSPHQTVMCHKTTAPK